MMSAFLSAVRETNVCPGPGALSQWQFSMDQFGLVQRKRRLQMEAAEEVEVDLRLFKTYALNNAMLVLGQAAAITR